MFVLCPPKLYSRRPQTSGHGPIPVGLWSVRTRATQGMSGAQASKDSSVFTATPQHSHYSLNTSCQSSSSIRFSQESHLTLNCVCEGSRWPSPCESPMPDDLILHYGELYNDIIISHDAKSRNKMHNKCNALESSQDHPCLPLLCGKNIFHETGPLCQNGWGPLPHSTQNRTLYTIGIV